MDSGILVLDKSAGLTSQSAVTRVKRLFDTDKAGHAGTLDPMATGVLPILLGRAVKASEFLLTGDKHYRAGLLLGLETDTEDTTGTILSEYGGALPPEEEVLAAIASFAGEGMQVPPMYSAVRIDGRRLYELAREGTTVEREARPIRIDSIRAKRVGEREYLIDVRCSKGTYIRTLCADIGRKLGVGGAMSSLRRCDAAGFSLADAITLDQLGQMTPEERKKKLIPVEFVFRKKRRLILSPFFARLARAGQPIFLEKLGLTAPMGELLRIYDGETFFALGEVQEADGRPAVKPIRQFDI